MTTIRLPYNLFPFQKKFNSKIKDARFIALAGGRRSSKSFYAHHWLLSNGLQDETGGLNVWCAPTIKQAIKIGYREFLHTTAKWPKGLIEKKETQGLILICGKEFFFTSSDNADSMRGLKIKRIVMDEAAYQKESTWIEVIRPALADLRGNVLLTSTYNGFNWFYEAMQNPTFKCETWPTAINPIISPEELEMMKQQMDEQTYMQEILAIPTTAKGLVFEKVFSNENIIKKADWTKRKESNIGIGIDFGYNDPCAIGLFEYWIDPKDRYPRVIQFDEIRMRFELIEHIIVALIEKLKSYNINPKDLPMACDIAGLQTTGTSGASYIAKIDSKKIFKLLYEKINIEDRLNLVRSFFKNAAGLQRFFITDNCIETKKEIISYEIKDKEKPLSTNDHFPDMIGYFYQNIIFPLIPKKQKIESDKNTGHAKLKKCLLCGKSVITFKGENYCKICEEKLLLEV